MSLLLGLDVSPKRMGWALVGLLDGAPVACGCEHIDLPQNRWDHRRLTAALFDGPSRNMWGEVQAIYIEEPAVPPVSGTWSAYKAGRAVQAAHGEAARAWPWAPIEYLKPSEWRVLAGLSGKATKLDVRHAAIDMAPHLTAATDSQDAADALCLAVAGQRRNGENWSRAVERGDAA